MIEKVAADSGGVTSRYGPLLGGAIIAAGALAHCLAPDRLDRRAWWGLLVVTALAAIGLLALEATLLTAASAPLRVHALVLGGVLLSAPALVAFGRRAFASET
jgi:hypothetical protein